MSEEKRTKLRQVMEELKNTVNKAVVAQEDVISRDAIKECLRLSWVKMDEFGNYVPTELGRAMIGR